MIILQLITTPEVEEKEETFLSRQLPLDLSICSLYTIKAQSVGLRQ